MGKESYLKLTNVDFTQRLDIDSKGNWDYDHAIKRELANDAVFETVFD
jgi:hypothetical protein